MNWHKQRGHQCQLAGISLVIAIALLGCGGKPEETSGIPDSALVGSSLPDTEGNPHTLILGKWQQVAFITPTGEPIPVDDSTPSSPNPIWEFQDNGRLTAFGEEYRYEIKDDRLITRPVAAKNKAMFEFGFFVSQKELVAATDEVTLKFVRLGKE